MSQVLAYPPDGGLPKQRRSLWATQSVFEVMEDGFFPATGRAKLVRNFQRWVRRTRANLLWRVGKGF